MILQLIHFYFSSIITFFLSLYFIFLMCTLFTFACSRDLHIFAIKVKWEFCDETREEEKLSFAGGEEKRHKFTDRPNSRHILNNNVRFSYEIISLSFSHPHCYNSINLFISTISHDHHHHHLANKELFIHNNNRHHHAAISVWMRI